MPPQPGVWEGRDTVVQSWIDGGFGSESFGSMRCVVTRANRQPAAAAYVRKPGDQAYAALALDVLRIVDGTVSDVGPRRVRVRLVRAARGDLARA